MRIAGVSMTYNDGYKLKEWVSHYQVYKDQLECFVIVDNGSDDTYKKELKEAFPEAIIIERSSNGGCTAAYNDGIRYVLDSQNVDSIAIIANDIKLTPNCLKSMHEYLFSDSKMGMVSSAILNIDSMIVDNYGHTVKGFVVTNCDKGVKISDITPKRKETELVSGGFNIAKVEFYKEAGIQDEKLFMYCDELDTTFKAKKAGFKMGVIADEYAWHWHINPPESVGIRHPESRYMISRNRVYLTKKYMGMNKVLSCFIYTGILAPAKLFFRGVTSKNRALIVDAKYGALGALYGILGNMKKNKFSFPLKEG